MTTYKEMYEEAVRVTNGSYKGYTGGNALSLYVGDKYDVNAVDNPAAHDALIDAFQALNNSESDDFI